MASRVKSQQVVQPARERGFLHERVLRCSHATTAGCRSPGRPIALQYIRGWAQLRYRGNSPTARARLDGREHSFVLLAGRPPRIRQSICSASARPCQQQWHKQPPPPHWPRFHVTQLLSVFGHCIRQKTFPAWFNCAGASNRHMPPATRCVGRQLRCYAESAPIARVARGVLATWAPSRN